MEQVLSLLLVYKYTILIPLSIIEGPIIAIVAGFFVSLGIMNLIVVYLILVAGDIIGDGGLYALGRWGNLTLVKIGPKLGITEKKMEEAKEFFDKHHGKAVSLSKFIHGIGFTGLIMAGILKIPYAKYFKTCLLITLIQSIIMILTGFFFGHAYVQTSKYLNEYAAVVSVATLSALVVFIIYKFKIITPR